MCKCLMCFGEGWVATGFGSNELEHGSCVGRSRAWGGGAIGAGVEGGDGAVVMALTNFFSFGGVGGGIFLDENVSIKTRETVFLNSFKTRRE